MLEIDETTLHNWLWWWSRVENKICSSLSASKRINLSRSLHSIDPSSSKCGRGQNWTVTWSKLLLVIWRHLISIMRPKKGWLFVLLHDINTYNWEGNSIIRAAQLKSSSIDTDLCNDNDVSQCISWHNYIVYHGEIMDQRVLQHFRHLDAQKL